jgi:hypothetical protein
VIEVGVEFDPPWERTGEWGSLSFILISQQDNRRRVESGADAKGEGEMAIDWVRWGRIRLLGIDVKRNGRPYR